MTRKTLTITIIFVILVLLLGGFAYYYFFIKNTEKRVDFFESGQVDLFPSEQPSDTVQQDDNLYSNDTDITSSVLPVPKFRKIHNNPVAGAVFIKENDDERGDRIRFIERATGHIYETWTKSLEKRRISNTTIPKIYGALWNKSGNGLLIRYLDENSDDIITYYAKLVESDLFGDGSNYKIEGYFLQKNILFPSLSKDRTKMFYFVKNSDGISGVKSNIDGSNSIEIFSSPIKEWLVEWFGNGFLLKTKPTFKTGGHIYKLNNNGTTTKLLENIYGLTAIGKSDGSNILYTRSSKNSFDMFSYNTKSDKYTKPKFKTIPDKCVWSEKSENIVYCAIPKSIPSGKYPDDWYQGVISFDDVIWIINVNSDLGSIVVDPSTYSEAYSDAINLMLSEDEKYLIFINKKDYSLWGLEL